MIASDPLGAESVAAHIAPVIDRLRLAVAQRSNQLNDAAGLFVAAGVSKPAMQVFSMMRNTFPARGVTVSQVGAAFIYQGAHAVDAPINELVGAGLVDADAERSLRLSDSGRVLMQRLHAIGADAVAEMWGTGSASAEALLPLVDRALSAASLSGREGFALMAPPYDAPDASAEVRLSERLAGLRFHRFDAHVAAWTAAGLTAQAVRGLAPGPARDAIERETNRRAAAPYAVLDPRERLDLLAGLGALKG